jgi:hypothetical protein
MKHNKDKNQCICNDHTVYLPNSFVLYINFNFSLTNKNNLSTYCSTQLFKLNLFVKFNVYSYSIIISVN